MSLASASLLAISSFATGLAVVTAAYNYDRPITFWFHIALIAANGFFAVSYLAGAA